MLSLHIVSDLRTVQPAANSTGISVMGDMPWGTHFCFFWENKEDLLDATTAFFRAGLEDRQFCLWAVFRPVTQEEALCALREAIPDLDRHLAAGAMEIMIHSEEIPEPRETMRFIQQKLDAALAQGYSGIRIAGSPACLQKGNPNWFREFEFELGKTAAQQRIIALCYFSLAESSAAEILDAARSHRFVLARPEGDWKIIETAESRRAHAEITKLNEQLENRVEERTRALEAANEELRREIARRERVEEDLRQQKEILQTIFNHVPVGVNFIDKSGQIKVVNREWERMIGHTLDEIVSGGFDIFAEAFPQPADRQRAIDFMERSSSEWEDFEKPAPDGSTNHTTWAVVRLSDGSRIGIGQDITQRKQAEQELRKQKEILQTIFDHIPVMINFGDGENFYLVNREWERTLGWSLEEIQSQGIDIVAENYPDPEYRKIVQEFIANSNAEWADFKVTVRDGRVVDISWAMLHLSDGTGIGIGQDITKRKRAEEALRESEERFRQLAENIQDLFWIKTPDFKRVLYLSPVYNRMSGRSLEERYNDTDYQPFLDRIVPEDRQKMAEIMRRGAHEFDVEFRIVHGDGSLRWIRDRGFPIRDQSGQIYRIAGIAQDITARKLAEEALRESEERFRQLAANISEVFWLRSPDFKQLLYVSPMYEKICGRTCQSLYEAGHGFVGVHPEDRARVIETVERLAGSEFDIEYRIITKDGDVRWIRDRGFPIRDQSGRIYRIGGVAEDITERKESDDRLKASSEQLRALSANLQSAREQEATRIAHQVHDELGGTLTGLRWELEALSKMIPETADPARFEAMQQKLATMLGLTDATINVVRSIASELRPSILDDLGLMEAIEWQTQQFQARTGIECSCESSMPSIPLPDQTSTAVFRIVQEALTNIIRHAQATRVDIAMREQNQALVLTVTDNGRGITESEKTSRKSLGLLGMQERAHLIGASVEIVGLPGAGTTLEVRVPLSKTRPAGAV